MNRTAAAGLAAVLMLGLAACSEDEPRPDIAEPTATASPSESVSPPTTTPLAPVIAETPKAAVKVWVDGWNTLSSRGDDAQISSVSSSNCVACQNFIDPVMKVYADGGRIRTKGWSIAALAQSTTDGKRVAVDAAVDKAGGRTRLDSDSMESKFAPDKEIIRFTLVSRDDRWLVADLATLR